MNWPSNESIIATFVPVTGFLLSNPVISAFQVSHFTRFLALVALLPVNAATLLGASAGELTGQSARSPLSLQDGLTEPALPSMDKKNNQNPDGLSDSVDVNSSEKQELGEIQEIAPDNLLGASKAEPLASGDQKEIGATLDGNSSVDIAAINLFPTYMLLGVILVALAIASIVGQYLRRQPSESINAALVSRFSQRVNTWWLMSAILTFSIAIHSVGTVILFAMVSFWALREFITMAPTRRGDHRALFWALIVFTPLQYVLIGLERMKWLPIVDYYGLYSIMIPVYASIFVPARIALSGDHKRFLERSAQITSGLLICVYALSHAPALINLNLAGSEGTPWNGSPVGLFFFFVLLSQLSEIFQWTWGQIVGRRLIAEDVSSSRTWEGFVGGTLSLGIVGAALWWVTPFKIWEAACMSMVIGVMGMFGCMTMSAIKRDRGVTDYGTLVQGHAGILDRIDTLCFAAPVFFHLTRFFFTL